MLPASVSLVLRQQPCADALEHLGPYLSSFLGPPRYLSLHQACTFGSTTLLDWIWDSSCTSGATRTASWSLHNFLRSDPHYHRWEFAMATEIAAKRGDVAIMEWLLTHFQDCEVPIETTEQAASKGHVAILQLLLKYDTSSQEVQEPRVKKRKGATERGEAYAPNSGGGHIVLWKDRRDSYRSSIMAKAVRNGRQQVARWLYANVPGQYDEDYAEDAVSEAIRTGDMELAKFFLPRGRTLLDFVGQYEQSVEAIEIMLDAALFEQCSYRDTYALPLVARAGRLDLLQRLSQNYNLHVTDWQRSWISALVAACSHGHCAVVRWMIEHSMWRGVRKLLVRNGILSELLWCAVGHGSIEVMQCLQDLRAVDRYGDALVEAVAKNDRKCVSWLLENFPQSERVPDYAVLDEAARRGNLELLQYFESVGSVPGFASKPAKSRRGAKARMPSSTLKHVVRGSAYRYVEDIHAEGRYVVNLYIEDDRLEERSSWNSTDAMDDAAANGHLLVVQWLHENRSEGCTTEAMDCAAANGHLEVVKWLHSNRSEGFTTKAMDGAASHGHLDVVQWLHTNTSASCTIAAMDGAAEHGSLKMLKWLHSNRSKGCTVKAIENAIAHNHLGAAIWLAAAFPSFAPVNFTCSSEENMFDLILFVHAHYPELIRSQEFRRHRYTYKTAGAYHRNWLEKHYPSHDSMIDYWR